MLHLGVPCFVIWIGFGIYALEGLNHDCPIYASHIVGMLSLYSHTHLFISWDVVSFFFGGMGSEIKASHLQSSHSSAWATPPLKDGVLFNFMPVLALNHHPPNRHLPKD
jgi:hypothetical protein